MHLFVIYETAHWHSKGHLCNMQVTASHNLGHFLISLFIDKELQSCDFGGFFFFFFNFL